MSYKKWKHVNPLGSGSGVVSLDVTNNTTFSVTLSGSVTFSFDGSTPDTENSINLLLLQDATGSRTVTWPGNVLWPGGTPAVLSTAANALDLVTVQTFDSGATWYGALIGANYS